MSWQTFTDLDAFLTSAREFLEASPAAHNLALGIIDSWRSNPDPAKKPPFSLCGVECDMQGCVRAVFLQSMKATILCGDPSDPACRAIPGLLSTLDRNTTGIVGPLAPTTNVAEHWASLPNGPRIRHRSMERIHELRSLAPPQGVKGHARIAEPRDLETLASFGYEFAAEAIPQETHSLEEMRQWAKRQIELRRSCLWIDECGAIVSTASINRTVPGGAAISLVYTPPAHRGRGYGAAVTAATSQAVFDQGGSFCCLYTDLANPISNKIYAQIGYRPVLDTAHLRFDWS